MTTIWTEFGACLLLIAVAGTRLSIYGDVIADKSGLSRSWVGLILLAIATSLPELMTGVSSVSLAGTPDIALGDVLGSCVFNLAILVLVDFFHRPESLYRRASQGHILSAGFSVVLIGLVGFSILLGPRSHAAIGHVGFYSPLIVLLYLVAIRAIYVYEREKMIEFTEEVDAGYRHLSLKRALGGYLAAGAVVVAAGVAMPFVAKELARAMGWHTSFVGTLLVAAATSMPELAVTIAALRLGALDMAVANLLGSNLFNIVIVVVDDVFYRPGALLSEVSPVHALSAMSALAMTGLAIVGLFYRPGGRILRTVGWVSLGLFGIYVLNSTVLYLDTE